MTVPFCRRLDLRAGYPHPATSRVHPFIGIRPGGCVPARRAGPPLPFGASFAGLMNNELTQQKTERNTTMRRPAMKFQITAIALGCATLISGCGGGSNGSSDGGVEQTMDFSLPFSGQAIVPLPGSTATTTLKATASSGGTVTYTSNTPDTCSVSGDQLSLLKAGECSVTATQAGSGGYAPVSKRQLFIIPKNPQLLIFRNPGAQPLDSTPVTLAATSSIPDHPVTFSTSTPTVCSVSGNSMTKIADGICTVTATQAGDDTYAETEVVKNIPIGSATSPALTFLSGYKDATHSNENGAISAAALTSENGWWCNGLCATSVAADGSSFTFDFTPTLPTPADGRWIGTNWDLSIFAGGLSALASGANTPAGVRIDAQAALKFNFAENPEWFSTSDNKLKVQLTLGHYMSVPDSDPTKPAKDCNVTLQALVTPTSAAAADYSVNLKNDFKISESCGLTGLDLWNELQDYPISKVDFLANTLNLSVPNAGTTATYRTQATFKGPITFQ
jgi:hypothetical protein